MKKDKDSSARVKDSDELYFTISDAAQQVGVDVERGLHLAVHAMGLVKPPNRYELVTNNHFFFLRLPLDCCG